MVKEWPRNPKQYEPFMSLSGKTFEEIAMSYKAPGSFSGDCGNLMVMALANVLKVNIIIFTSMEQMPVLPVIPRDSILTPDPIYVAFNHAGCGHYDAVGVLLPPTSIDDVDNTSVAINATAEFSNQTTSSVEGKMPQKTGCKCGKGGAKDKSERTFCHQVPGGRRTQCPCYRNHLPCTELCRCNNCSNPLGSRSLKRQSEYVPQKRERERHPLQNCHQDNLTFMLERGEQPCNPKWSCLEKFLLQNLVDTLIKTGHTIDELDIPALYNQLVDIVIQLSLDLPLSNKTSRCVGKQMEIVYKEAELFRQIYLNQVTQNVGTLDSDVTNTEM